MYSNFELIQAMNQITSNVPCVSFVGRTSQNDYVDLINSESGCYAFFGNFGGRHELNLQPGGCIVNAMQIQMSFLFIKESSKWALLQHVGIVIHEFLHVLGAPHEQGRPDRNDHVEILWENIQGNNERQFYKYSWTGQSSSETRCGRPGAQLDTCVNGLEVARWPDLGYDLDSIMHYSNRAYVAFINV